MSSSHGVLSVIGDRARRRAAGLVLVGAVLLGACTGDDPTASDTTPPASPSQSPSPSPARQLQPVVGERVSAVYPLGSRPVLGLGENPEADQDAIDAASAAVGDWLDQHLDTLQRDGEGSWGDIAAEGLADADERTAVTTDLASPDAPVEAARYIMSVYHDGPPRYLTARVEVTHPDESVATAELVFVTAEDGAPTLTMFGPAADTEVAE